MSTPADRAIDLFVAKITDAFFDNPHTENPLNIKSREEVELVCREIRKVCREMFDIYTVSEVVDYGPLESASIEGLGIKYRLTSQLSREFIERDSVSLKEQVAQQGGVKFTASLAVLRLD